MKISECDLTDNYYDQLKEIGRCKDSTRFDLNSFSIGESEFKTNKIVIQKGIKGYGLDDRVEFDVAIVTAPKEVLGCLSLLILSSVLHKNGENTVVRLSNTNSDVSSIFIPGVARREKQFPITSRGELVDEVVFVPSEVGRHPWHPFEGDINELPYLYFSSEMIFDGTSTNETLVGFGNQIATTRFAFFLLNIGLGRIASDEFDLESEWGYCGVAPNSSELKIWLPGSFGWESDYFD